MNNVRSYKEQLKVFHWKTFGAITLNLLVPFIYLTIRTRLISINTDTSGIDIVGQLEWFDLINETFLAFITLPLYSIFAKQVKNRKEFNKTFTILGTSAIVLYLIFQLFVFIYCSVLVNSMNPAENNLSLITQYLQLETVAFMISIIPTLCNIVFISLKKNIAITIMVLANLIVLICGDFGYIKHFGVIGVAYSNITGQCIFALISVIFLFSVCGFRFTKIEKQDYAILKTYLKRGSFSGIQSFLDNIIYIVMVVKMVNMIQEQGNYWVANNFIWTFSLIPILALNEVIKSEEVIKEKDGFKYDYKFKAYVTIVLFTLIFWLISLIGLNWYYRDIQKLSNYNEIFLIIIKLLPFYIFYAFYSIIDSIFINKGKTYLLFINSFIVNIFYYGLFFLAYINDHVKLTMDVIIMMFGFGHLVHLAVSLAELMISSKNERTAKRHKNKFTTENLVED